MDNKNNPNTGCSVRKADIYEAIRNKKPFSVLPNEVLQNLREPLALAVWCYLQSLPPDWKIIKSQIRDHFSLGEKKCKSIFSLLHELKLVEYIRLRNPDGTLGAVDVVINDGFDYQSPDTTGAKTSPVVTTGAILHPVVNHTCGKEGTTNTNIYTNTIKEKKEREKEPESVDNFPLKPIDYKETLYSPFGLGLSEQEKKEGEESFELFFNVYPVQQNYNRAKASWFAQRCFEIFETIMTALNNLILHDSRFKEGYAPNPDKWIQEERWNDKPLKRPPRSIKTRGQSSPDWDLNMHQDIF